jgi:thiamine biosynthesis lipoprotein
LATALVPVVVFGLQAPADETVELPVVAWQGRTMGSPYTVQIVDGNLTEAQVAALKVEINERLVEINRPMSHYQPDSELSKFNRAVAHTPFQVSPEFAQVMRFTMDFCRRSDGALDPTLAPVINLWGFGETTSQHAVPSDTALAEALKKTGWKHLSVTDSDELIKDIPELTINLGAVAKGFGVDEMIKLLQAHGLTNSYASIAGEVRVLGHNARHTAWSIGISAPIDHWNESHPMAAATSLYNQALSTSGDYHKFFHDEQGRRLCHIFDSTTGWPVQHQVTGVSVVAPDSMTADALGTALFVLGPEAGMKLLETYPHTGALFIHRQSDGSLRQIVSPTFTALTGYRP